MRVLAVIPARGGSKGIPGKNLAAIAGKPLVAHTIGHALAARAVDRVAVSTDDPEIAAVALRLGAEVVPRPAELALDDSSSESALLHALDHFAATESYVPGLLVFLQCTAPVRAPGDIDAAVATLLDQEADSLLSVVRSHRFLWRVDGGRPEALNYDWTARPRRQDRAPEFVENGSIYVLRPWVLRDLSTRLGGRIALYEMGYWSQFDIDDNEDLTLCEWILTRQG